jgi:hypothetical protein
MESTQWFHVFFQQARYHSVQELLDSAGEEMSLAREFVTWSLSLRRQVKNRHTVAEVLRFHATGSGRHGRWYRPFLRSLWTLYTTMQQLCVRATRVEDVHVHRLTKTQRDHLAGSGAVRLTRERAEVRAQRMFQQLKAACSGCTDVVMWMDNFNKQRYRRNPHEERNRCINGCVVALWPLRPEGLQAWDQYPSVDALREHVDATSRWMATMSGRLLDGVRDLLLQGKTWNDVRVPCDLRRTNVVPRPWRPFTVLRHNIGDTIGLLECIDFANATGRRFRMRTIVLVDVNPGCTRHTGKSFCVAKLFHRTEFFSH